jgi:hypothetical protein
LLNENTIFHFSSSVSGPAWFRCHHRSHSAVYHGCFCDREHAHDKHAEAAGEADRVPSNTAPRAICDQSTTGVEMKSPAPLAKIQMIERSMSCFTLGLFGLLPVIGIPMAAIALAKSRLVKLNQGDNWNPGERFRFWGAFFARVGIGLTLILGAFVGILIYRPWEP